MSLICQICLLSSDFIEQLTHELNERLLKICPDMNELGEDHKICQTCKIKLLDASAFQEMCYLACSILKQKISSLSFVVKGENDEKQDSPENIDTLFDDFLISEEQILAEKTEVEENYDNRIGSSFEENDENNDENDYKCKMCHKSFQNELGLKMHIGRVHTDARMFTCDICSKTFSTRNHLRRHYWGTHKQKLSKTDDYKRERVFQCDYCDRMFSKKHHIENHMISHMTENRPFRCDNCFLTFLEQSQLDLHKKSHEKSALTLTPIRDEERGIFKCYFCSKEFNSEYLLCGHLKAHKANLVNAIFRCSRCSKAFTTKKQYSRHIRIHEDKSFKCRICDKSFIFMSQLKPHLLTHEPKEQREMQKREHKLCFDCGKSFKRSKNLRDHIKQNHQKDNHEALLCSVCGKKFSNKNNLKQHTYTHTDRYDYQCELCPSKFKTYTQLYNHKELHGEKKWACDQCGIRFSKKESLKVHTRLHTGELPYACTWPDCLKKFNSSSNLINHYRTHTGEKPFACPYCGQSFTQKFDMIKHSRIHADPYKCDQCPATFKFKRDLKPHLQEHIVAERMKGT